MTNKRNTEMAKKAAVLGLFGLLVIIIIGIALAVYFGTQKTQATDELPEDLGPQIEVDSLSAKYNPAPEGVVEEYTIEGYTIEGYAAEGDINYTELSKSVDMTINWFNQSGFQNINELVIKRYVDNSVKATKTLKKSNSSESKYFESFSDILTYTFEGKDVTYSVVGVNKIKIFYKNASNQEVELTPSDLDGVEVKKEQLAQTLDMVSPVTVEYKPSTSDQIIVNPDIDRKGYFMYPGGSNLSIQEYIKVGTPHGMVFLVPSGTKNTTVKIKLEQDGTFIKYENNTFSFDSSNGTEFTLVKGEIDGTLRLKAGDRFVAVKDDKLVMLKIDEITTREIYKTLDTTVTETPAQKQDCVFQWEEGTVNKSTGKRTDTYKLITKAGGGGTPCEYTESGPTREVAVKVDCEGGWNDWGNCSKTCGSGTRTRTWNTTVTPLNNGAACPATQTQSCNTQSCKTCKPSDSLKGWASEYNMSPGGLYDCSRHKNESECEAAGGDFTGYGSWDFACDWK